MWQLLSDKDKRFNDLLKSYTPAEQRVFLAQRASEISLFINQRTCYPNKRAVESCLIRPNLIVEFQKDEHAKISGCKFIVKYCQHYFENQLESQNAANLLLNQSIYRSEPGKWNPTNIEVKNIAKKIINNMDCLIQHVTIYHIAIPQFNKSQKRFETMKDIIIGLASAGLKANYPIMILRAPAVRMMFLDGLNSSYDSNLHNLLQKCRVARVIIILDIETVIFSHGWAHFFNENIVSNSLRNHKSVIIYIGEMNKKKLMEQYMGNQVKGKFSSYYAEKQNKQNIANQISWFVNTAIFANQIRHEYTDNGT